MDGAAQAEQDQVGRRQARNAVDERDRQLPWPVAASSERARTITLDFARATHGRIATSYPSLDSRSRRSRLVSTTSSTLALAVVRLLRHRQAALRAIDARA